MQVYNQTRYVHEFTMGMDPSAREFLSVVVKGTFDFPPPGKHEVTVAQEQVPLVMADICTGEPGYSATLWETDFAFRKPFCDIILNGCAYAPADQMADRVRVGLKVGTWSKIFDVVGDRYWVRRGPMIRSTAPKPFAKKAITYDVAFGGRDAVDPNEELPEVFLANPVGRGWHRIRNQSRITGAPLPNTEEVNDPVRAPWNSYRPMSFGPFGRGWPGRIEFGGTYDQNWIDNVFPFLPKDFDERYYQSAPPDQQTAYPKGGEDVVLIHLTPEGRTAFRLPDLTLPIRLFKRLDEFFSGPMTADTLAFDSEARRFSVTWRIDKPIKKHILEYTEAWIGPPTEAMLRARREGRQYIRDVDWNVREEADA